MRTTLGTREIARRRHTAVRILALLGLSLASIARGQAVTEFPIPTAASYPHVIAAAQDGHLWFAEGDSNKIGRISTSGIFDEIPVPTAGSDPTGMAAGPDGSLWFTEASGNKIGRIPTTIGVVSEFPIPTANSGSGIITAGPDGNMWFAEYTANQIGRIDSAGVITEFPTPTAGSGPFGIAVGPDGNIWFTEANVNQIARMTLAGAVTEFAIPTSGSVPLGIAAGPDGNLWFTESAANQIGRITVAGLVTEFPIPTASSAPRGIGPGPDGSLWFTEAAGSNIGRITTAGLIDEYPIPTAASNPRSITAGPDGSLWATEAGANAIGRITTGPTLPRLMSVDAHAVTGSVSDGNGVLEPGETVQVAPSWNNTLTDPQTFTGTASNLTGPTATYALVDGAADYGSVSGGATSDCNGATGDCYLMTVSGARPAAHWDATFTEDLSSGGITKSWTLHVGDSFVDVPRSHQFYGYIENLFHNGLTGGCAVGNYCPGSNVTRAQMAVFLMRGKLGASHVPAPSTGTVFNDVPLGAFGGDFIEELARFQITGGCGNGNYCPQSLVTRAQMAVFLLKSEHGSAYTPPACASVFGDVNCPSQFADWIEQLSVEGITGGCGNGNYCPDSPITRGQMAVFLVKTFGLQLYGPVAPRIGPANPYSVSVTLVVEGHNEHFEFRPSTIHIHVGDTIIWALDGIHSSTGPDWDSGVGPSSFAHTFTEAGSFDYHCTAGSLGNPHHHNPGVVVVDP